MTKITGIYKVAIPNIPINVNEIPKQRPIHLFKDNERIVIYAPGNSGEKVWKKTQGKHKILETGVSKRNIININSLYILVEKEGLVSDDSDVQDKYDSLGDEAEKIAFQLLRLLRRKLPKTPIAIPNQFEFKALCKCDSESQKNVLWLRNSINEIIYLSSEYCLDNQKWIALKKSIKENEDTELWEDFVFDANAALRENDLNRAILYTAIGYEIFIKEYTEKAAKKAKISAKFWEYLKRRQPSVLDYYDSILHLVKGHSLKTEKPNQFKLLERLNKARNDIMHAGKLSLTAKDIYQLEFDIENVNQVIDWVNAL